ncbi:hypothetical protein KC318_g1764 [Hortaea werneckii]|nr:hypothetical protein KC334_g1665 [Hortaea werneckii]KAI7012544.1 hypothetical protein KC355_g5375 [Hortaea werneckii]KAI7172913.1 hypothetical protein KC324_g10612 [Hortaea werneckii]KAI7576328.1 hypothetical protein KC316_g10743 [Hortaea werneckii]KAI7674165.1 hypothetical protein KC318_g1764 [Hortaea werneckii]
MAVYLLCDNQAAWSQYLAGCSPLYAGCPEESSLHRRCSNATTIIAVAVTFSVLSFCACALRFYCKLVFVRAVGLDDAAVVSSLILGIAYCANSIYQTRWGFGLDEDQIPAENVVTYSKIQYAGGPLYATGILGFKLSLLLVYHRLAGFKPTYRRVLWAAMALVTLNSVIFAFMFAFSCDPPMKTWNREVPGKCLDEVAFYFGLAGIVTIGLGAMFGLGIFITIVQILRVQTIATLESYTDSQQPITWSMVEIHVGCLVACIPTYTPLLRKLGGKVTRTYRDNRSAVFRRHGSTITAESSHRVGERHARHAEASPHGHTNKRMTCADDELALWDTNPEKGQAAAWAAPNAYRMTALSRDEDSVDEETNSGNSLGLTNVSAHRDNEITVTREIRITDVA